MGRQDQIQEVALPLPPWRSQALHLALGALYRNPQPFTNKRKFQAQAAAIGANSCNLQLSNQSQNILLCRV